MLRAMDRDCEAEGLEFGTIRQRRQHLRLHVAPFIGREKLSDLSTPRIHKFDAELRDAGRSIAMRRKVLTNLKTAISFAQGRGEVSAGYFSNEFARAARA